jgi:DNA helicase HerA-like ATPase
MAVGMNWKVKPAIETSSKGVWIGPGTDGQDGLWLGTLAESVAGRQPQVWLNSAKEQVVAIVGKRGSGKSFTLGVLIEGLVSGVESRVGKQYQPRAALIFDPMDIYWTTKYPVTASDNSEVNRHFEMAKTRELNGLSFDVEAWIPGDSNRRNSDPDWFRTLQLSVPALGLQEWELLLGVNVFSEPMGQALSDALTHTRDSGFHISGEAYAAASVFDIDALLLSLTSDELVSTFHNETLRALRQRLAALSATGLFHSVGTTIRQLLSPGRATVILLGRLPESYRNAVVSLLTRLLMAERSEAAFAEKRLELDPELTKDTRNELESMLHKSIPRTVVFLDEAQTFLAPGPSSGARELFTRLVKEGRNMGLSAVIATQQPSAIDSRILSQVETFIAHQLVTETDIRAVRDNLKSALPASIAFGQQELDDRDLLRQLPSGTCLVSAADMNTQVRRSIVVDIRPRASVHGGLEL